MLGHKEVALVRLQSLEGGPAAAWFEGAAAWFFQY